MSDGPADTPLAALTAAVARARRRRDAETRFGSAPIELHLTSAGREALWDVLDHLTRAHPEVYAGVGSDVELESLIVDIVASDLQPDIAALARAVIRATRRQPRFLVAVPIANCARPASVVRLRRDVALAPAPTPEESWAVHERAVVVALGDAFSPPGRRTHGTGQEPTMDSRIAATLFFREPGPLVRARRQAAAKARYALAAWCVLHPPGDGGEHPGFTLWPSVADWIAKPAVAVEHPARAFIGAPAARRTTRPRGTELQYADYELPTSRRSLTGPFRAMARVEQHHSARCLLSTAIAVWEALHIPGEHAPSARALHLHAAVDALCDARPQTRGKRGDRWPTVCERLGVTVALARDGHPIETQQRSWAAFDAARHVRAHGSDAYALDVGGAIRTTRSSAVLRSELAPALARADLGRVAEAVMLATRRLWRLMDGNGWDDELYERQFAAQP